MNINLVVRPKVRPPVDTVTSLPDGAASAPRDACEGDSAPEPSATCEPSGAPDFGAVHPLLRAALVERGFDSLTSVQLAVLDTEVEGRDLQISSQTGSGKTVALGFVLAQALTAEAEASEKPAARGPEALVIVPTRELAMQVSEELGWLLAALPGMEVASVTGGSPLYLDRKLLARRPRVLVGTPGRLLDHVTSGVLELGNVHALVLDEADQMLDMGFREELEGILEATPKERRTHMVSATFPAGILRLAERYQANPVSIEGSRLGEANQDIEHIGILLQPDSRYAALVNLLLLADRERTLVFVQQRAEAIELAEKLEQDGFTALPLSGELAQSQRVRTLAAFRSGGASVLVATDVAARGLDVPDVMMVVHTTPPINAQVYTHRSGRTGRAGMSGRSVVFTPPSRRRRVERLISEAGAFLNWRQVPTADYVREELATRARKALEQDLAERLAAQPSAPHVELAQELLAKHDAAALVAVLLARQEPAQKAIARDVPAMSGPGPQRREDFGRGDARQDRASGGSARPLRNQGSQAGPGRARQAERSPREPRREGYAGANARQDGSASRGRGERGGFEPRGRGDMVRFFVNWGGNQGADPRRLLAAVCRRGEVSGQDIGSIAIHPNASTFDVSADVAERFERLASRRDPRDPRTLIRRDRGPRAAYESTRY